MDQTTNSKNKSILFILIGLVILLSSYFIYTSFFSKPNLSRIILNTYEYYTSENVKSGEMVFSQKYNINFPENLDLSLIQGNQVLEELYQLNNTLFNLDINLTWQENEDNSPISRLNIDFSFENPEINMLFGKQRISAELIMINKIGYLKLNEIPSALITLEPMFGMVLEQFKEGWIEIPVGNLLSMLGVDDLDELLSDESLMINEEQLKILQSYSSLLKTKGSSFKDLPEIGRVREIQVSVLWDKFPDFFEELLLVSGIEVSENELLDIRAEINEIQNLSFMKNYNFNFYTKNNVIVGMSSFVPIVLEEVENQEIGRIEMQALIKNINEEFEITRPASSVNVMQILAPFIMMMF